MESLAQSPTDADFVQNPYAFYDRARARGPFFYWQEYGLTCATGFAATDAILRDRRLGREVPPDRRVEVPDHLTAFYAIEAHSMLELEPPRHTRLRGLVLRAFTSRRIAALGPEIEALCHELLDAMPHDADLLVHYAQKLPVIIIARLLGVPESMAPQLLVWSRAMVGMYLADRSRATEDAAALAARDFADFLRGYAEARRDRPADDLITHLLAAEAEGERLSTDELITTCILLLNAGHEATVHSIGNGVKTLLQTGTRFDAAPAPQMVEEILRFDPPLHLFTRWAYEDVEIAGQSFAKGSQVALLLAAANRDPAAFPDPHRFYPGRAAKANLAFGGGLHFCVGAPLARLEMQIALRVLFERCPGLQLTAPPRYADLFHFHGLDRLMVSTDGSTGG